MSTAVVPTCAGIQLTSVSHVEDVAAMMAAAAGNHAAIKQHYNACSDRTYTLDGIAHCVAAALGKEPKIVHYNVKDFDIPKGKSFPFRTVHFFASADKAKQDLGWKAEHKFAEDLKTQVCPYLRGGGRVLAPRAQVCRGPGYVGVCVYTYILCCVSAAVCWAGA